MPRLSDFKAILFDADKTLTKSDGSIPTGVPKALKDLSKAGLELAICTGRNPALLKEFLFPYFPQNAVHICVSGSALVDNRAEIIKSHTINENTVKMIIKLAEASSSLCYISTAKKLYSSFISTPSSSYILKRFKMKPALISEAIELKKLDSVHGMTLSVNELFRPEICDGSTEDLRWRQSVVEASSPVLAKLQQFKDIEVKQVTRSTNGLPYLEITPYGVNKATGMKEWCLLKDIKSSEIIGIGDSENDLEFLQAVGYSVAMGNGTSKIKEIADKIIGDVDQDGLPSYLQQVIASGEL